MPKWIILQEGYAKYRYNCESPSQSRSGSACGDTKKLLRLAQADRKNNQCWVCAKHARRDYEIVGKWAKTWQSDFKEEDLYA